MVMMVKNSILLISSFSSFFLYFFVYLFGITIVGFLHHIYLYLFPLSYNILHSPLSLCSFLLFSSIFERWLRTHQPLRTSYPRANAPIGHNDGYYMVPFLPLYRNGDYFLSNKALGYEYAYLLDPGQYRTTLTSSKCFNTFPFMLNCLTLCISTTGQRFVQEFLTPYLQQAQQIWQWLLGAGLVGALIAAVIATLIVVARRKWKRNQRRERVSSYRERQPLLQSSSEEGSSSYQTTL